MTGLGTRASDRRCHQAGGRERPVLDVGYLALTLVCFAIVGLAARGVSRP
ncbi:hypothetical protein [Marinactinospora rubrisoli]|uniref:Uncharacterized protein n=1 Tax=Marinactinospora rubrisoli TaxID=2715399 RepID=A0ABW2KC53_9ACTN